LAREINEFLDLRIIFETGPDQILRPEGIDFKICVFRNRLGDASKMKYLIDLFHCFFQRGVVTTISEGRLDGKPGQPLQIPFFP